MVMPVGSVKDDPVTLGHEHHARELVPLRCSLHPSADLADHFRLGQMLFRPAIGALNLRVAKRHRAIITEAFALSGVGKRVDPCPMVASPSLNMDLERLVAGCLEHLEPSALLRHPAQPFGAIGNRHVLDRGLGHVVGHECESRSTVSRVDHVDQRVAQPADRSVGEAAGGIRARPSTLGPEMGRRDGGRDDASDSQQATRLHKPTRVNNLRLPGLRAPVLPLRSGRRVVGSGPRAC